MGFNLNNLRDQEKWSGEQKSNIKETEDILAERDVKDEEYIKKFLYKVLFKSNLIDERISFKKLLLVNQEEIEWLDISGIDYALLNYKKHKDLVVAYRRILFNKDFKNYIYDIETREYYIFNDLEKKYDKYLKEALESESIHDKRKYENYRPRNDDKSDWYSRNIFGLEYVYNYKKKSWELEHRDKLDINIACNMNISQQEKDECSNWYYKEFGDKMDSYYHNLFKTFSNSFDFLYFDALFWLKIVSRKYNNKNQRWDYKDKFCDYADESRELNNLYNKYKKNMCNFPLYKYIAEGLKIEKDNGKDFIVVPDFFSELQVFVFFNINIHQLFRYNKKNHVKPFLLKQNIENMRIAYDYIKDSRDKDSSIFLYECFFGINVCLCLTDYERRFKNKFDFEKMKQEFYGVAMRFLILPNICTRTIFIESILEPLLSMSCDNEEIIIQKLIIIRRELGRIILKENQDFNSLIKGFFIFESDIINEKGLFESVQEKCSNTLLGEFNEKIDGLIYVKCWEDMLYVDTDVAKGNIFPEDNKSYARYQKRYSHIIRKFICTKIGKSQYNT
jgi:hypothetical protein